MASTLPLLLVPGMLCSPKLYGPQAEAFGGEREIVIADNVSSDSVAGLAANILKTAPERFALAGLSLGGYISFEIMRQAPERVDRLALLDTRASADEPKELEGRRALQATARANGVDPAVKTLLPRLIHLDRMNEADLVDTIVAMAHDVGVEGFVNQIEAVIGRPDSTGDLAAIACPTVVVVGDHDALTPPHFARAMHEGIAGASLHVIPDCGHLSTIERPQKVNAVLRGWLKD